MLDPVKDEIVQLAALRVVNGRIVRLARCFGTLIDPQRPIPPGATAVHGHHAQMVDSRARISARPGRAFTARGGRRAGGALNAPFDMAFPAPTKAII